jgi:hypothetical protein
VEPIGAGGIQTVENCPNSGSALENTTACMQLTVSLRALYYPIRIFNATYHDTGDADNRCAVGNRYYTVYGLVLNSDLQVQNYTSLIEDQYVSSYTAINVDKYLASGGEFALGIAHNCSTSLRNFYLTANAFPYIDVP